MVDVPAAVLRSAVNISLTPGLLSASDGLQWLVVFPKACPLSPWLACSPIAFSSSSSGRTVSSSPCTEKRFMVFFQGLRSLPSVCSAPFLSALSCFPSFLNQDQGKWYRLKNLGKESLSGRSQPCALSSTAVYCRGCVCAGELVLLLPGLSVPAKERTDIVPYDDDFDYVHVSQVQWHISTLQWWFSGPVIQ